MNGIIPSSMPDWVYVPDVPLGLGGAALIVAGIIMLLACSRWWRILAMIPLLIGVVAIAWVIRAAQEPWRFSEPVAAEMIEKDGQQLLLYHPYPGSTHFDMVNLNIMFGRTFPPKSVFHVRYRDYGVYYGIHFCGSESATCVIDAPPAVEKKE